MNPYHLLLITENLEGSHMNNTTFLVYVDCHEICLKRGKHFVNFSLCEIKCEEFLYLA